MRARFLVVVVAAALVFGVTSVQSTAFAHVATQTIPSGAVRTIAFSGVLPPPPGQSSLPRPGRPPQSPNITEDPCIWVISWSAWAVDSNNVGGKAQLENGCSWTLTGLDFTVYPAIKGCTRRLPIRV